MEITKQKKASKICPTELFNKKIWTITETSEFLDLAVGTIYQLVSKKKIPYRKKGKRLYFIPNELLNWIQEG